MRIVFRSLAFALLLVVATGLVVLVPPHLQIRRIEPPLPNAAQLRALLDVADGPVGVEYVNTATQQFPGGTLGHNVVVAEWADGRFFMIDTAMDREGADEFRKLMEVMSGPGEATYSGNVAEILGDDVRRVTGVGFTHLHIDHAQGLGVLCRARGEGANVYQTRWQAEEHNLHTEEGAQIVAGSCLGRGPLAGDPIKTTAAFPGLGVVALGGHTPGSTLFAVPVGGHLWLFSGDITNSRSALLDDEDKGFFYSYIVVPENTSRTEALRAWLRSLDEQADMTVVVSHDIIALRASGMPEYSRR